MGRVYFRPGTRMIVDYLHAEVFRRDQYLQPPVANLFQHSTRMLYARRS